MKTFKKYAAFDNLNSFFFLFHKVKRRPQLLSVRHQGTFHSFNRCYLKLIQIFSGQKLTNQTYS